MRKKLVLAYLIISFVSLGFILGCGQGAGTSTTNTTASSIPNTTLSAGVSAAESAQSASQAILGIANISQSLGGMAGAGSGVTGMSAKSVKSLSGAPPEQFFGPLSADGWISMEGRASGESVQIRLYTKGGNVIDSAFIGSKNIASIEGFDWESMTSGGFNFPTFASAAVNWMDYPTAWNPSDPSSFYGNSNKYRALISLWDYIVWAHIATHPSMESVAEGAFLYVNHFPISAYPKLGTPEATNDDKLGTQETRVTGTHANGETIDLTMTVSTDADGKPVSVTGSGTIHRLDGVTMEVVSAVMRFVNGAPSTGSMDLRIGPPDNLRIVMTLEASGAATGTVYDTHGTEDTGDDTIIGTIVIYATPVNGHYGYYEDIATSTKHYF